MYSFVKKRHYELRNFWPNSGVAFDEGIRPKKHDCPNHLCFVRFANACGVASEKVCLKLSEIFRSNFEVGQGTKPRVDAVDYFVLFEQFFKNCPAPQCSLSSFLVYF